MFRYLKSKLRKYHNFLEVILFQDQLCCKEKRARWRFAFLTPSIPINEASAEFISHLTGQHFDWALLGSANNVWELAIEDYLDEFKDGEGRRALFGVNITQYAVELRVEATISKSKQEGAQQGNGCTEGENKMLINNMTWITTAWIPSC